LIYHANMIATKVEKQEMVLKPYFPSVTLAAVLSSEATKTLFPSCFSGVLCIAVIRIQVCKLQSAKH